jgi:8-oxo-dGTP pyrophosphatase MutT (NUDIX family)
MSKLDIMMLSFFNTLDELEEQEKTAAEQMRYRPKVQAFLYQPDGRILASKSQSAGLGLRPGNNYKFPGGGIEEGETMQDATRKELLEEAGWTTSGEPHHIGSAKIKWDDAFRQQALKKGRDYHGEVSHFVAAPAGQRDTSKFGSEGDALEGADFVHIDDLIRDLQQTSRDKNNEYRKFDQAKLKALTNLKNTHFTKKASADDEKKSSTSGINLGKVMKGLNILKEMAEQAHDASKAVRIQLLQNKMKHQNNDDVIDAMKKLDTARKAVRK